MQVGDRELYFMRTANGGGEGAAGSVQARQQASDELRVYGNRLGGQFRITEVKDRP